MVVYWCGYNFSGFASILFGKAIAWSLCTSQPNDILVFGAYGPCNCNPSYFVGRILCANGEDTQPKPYTERTFQIGSGGYPFPYGALEWLNRGYAQYEGPITHHAVAYTNSNCVSIREQMVRALTKKVVVHALGKCSGGAKKHRVPGSWWHNNKVLEGYAFAFAAEHGKTSNYVTEKAFMAAAAGAIPIYWGDELISKFMNPNRILFWNQTTPDHVQKLMFSPDLYRMRKLLAVNRSLLLKEASRVAAKVFTL